MTGAARKIAAFAVAITLTCVVGSALKSMAQDEPEPETSPIEQPQAEPTEWVPVTAGEAERGAPQATREATTSPTESTSTESIAPTESATPAEAPSAMTTSTVGTPTAQPSSPEHSKEPARDGKPTHQGAKTGATNIVPESSPFAGMNFSNQKGPTNIKSDTLNLDYQNKAIEFYGHVHAVQPSGDLTSDGLKVQYGKDFNDIKMMYADGNVRMSQGTRWITSDHAVLDQGKHYLTFLGNPVVHDGEDQITGSKIGVDLVNGKSTVQNPRVVIFPKESQNPDNVDSPNNP